MSLGPNADWIGDTFLLLKMAKINFNIGVMYTYVFHFYK